MAAVPGLSRGAGHIAFSDHPHEARSTRGRPPRPGRRPSTPRTRGAIWPPSGPARPPHSESSPPRRSRRRPRVSGDLSPGWPTTERAEGCDSCRRVRYPLARSKDGQYLLCHACLDRDAYLAQPTYTCDGCGAPTRDRFVTTLPGLRCARCARSTPTKRNS